MDSKEYRLRCVITRMVIGMFVIILMVFRTSKYSTFGTFLSTTLYRNVLLLKLQSIKIGIKNNRFWWANFMGGVQVYMPILHLTIRYFNYFNYMTVDFDSFYSNTLFKIFFNKSIKISSIVIKISCWVEIIMSIISHRYLPKITQKSST